MANIKTCAWCGREYDYDKSAAYAKWSYCSQKCEVDAKAAGK
jgi:DNA-directed RNA polymerase subunit RPC12/RpoP